MFDFHEKRKIRTIVYSKVSIGIILCLTVFLGISVFERFTVEREMAGKLEDKKQELETLKLRAEALESDVEHLKNERGIEEELRSRFDVVKEGEQVVVILDGENNREQKLPTSTSLTETNKKTVKSFWSVLKFW